MVLVGVIQPGTIHGKAGHAIVSVTVAGEFGFVKTGVNGADGLAHGKSPRGRNDFADERRVVGPLV